MPWSRTNRYLEPGFHTIPVGGEGNIRSSRLPPPSRPEDDDVDVDPSQRAGVPYPEWNQWTQKFLPNHVAVLERKLPPVSRSRKPVPANYRRWFEQHTHRVMRGRLEDGRSEEHTSELQSLMRISYAVFCSKKKKTRERQQ